MEQKVQFGLLYKSSFGPRTIISTAC